MAREQYDSPSYVGHVTNTKHPTTQRHIPEDSNIPSYVNMFLLHFLYPTSSSMFSDTFFRRSSLMETDQVSHPIKRKRNIKLCRLRCVYIICKNKDTFLQYTTACYSNHKQQHVSPVQGGKHQALCFRKVN